MWSCGRVWRALLTAVLVAGALFAAGCGSRTRGPRTRDANLVLDFTPNAVHAGIYTAIAQGYDRQAGVRLHVIAPSASTDSIRLLETGRVDFAILDIHDLAIARERGQDVVGIMAIVERPLAAVIGAPQIAAPRQLVGRIVGISGVPSDTAVLHSIVAGAGGDPRALRTVTIGFNAVSALLARRVAAVTAFWNDEGITLAHREPGFHVFRVDDYGAPAYPELVLCATRATLRQAPSLAQATVQAIVRGGRAAVTDPATAVAALRAQAPGLDRELLAAKLAAVAPAFRAPDGGFGQLDPAILRRWAAWEVRFGIVKQPPNVNAAFDPSFVRAAQSPPASS